MKSLLFTLFLLLIKLNINAQDGEYYKEISTRKKSFEVENLPNLNSKYNSLYFGLTAALRFSPYNESENFNKIGQNINNVNDYLEANLGLNLNNKLFIETGALRLKNQLASHILNSPYIYPFLLEVNSNQFYIPINIKREVLSLNKITRNASLNLSFGAAYQVYSTYYFDEEINSILVPWAHSPLINRVKMNTKHSKNPLLFHTGIEIRGNVTDRFEILAFGKGIFRENGYISNNFVLEYPSGTKDIYSINEKRFSIIIGLQLRFNSKRFYNYYSTL